MRVRKCLTKRNLLRFIEKTKKEYINAEPSYIAASTFIEKFPPENYDYRWTFEFKELPHPGTKPKCSHINLRNYQHRLMIMCYFDSKKKEIWYTVKWNPNIDTLIGYEPVMRSCNIDEIINFIIEKKYEKGNKETIIGES